MQANATDRVQKHRNTLRAMGMRPIQIWVPDTRQPAFAAESKRQSKLAADADLNDQGLMNFMDAALADIE
jgi:hypothetical protein